MDTAQLPQGRVWTLPPVILHPFSDPKGPDQLVESSRAHLMLEGLLPMGELTQEEILHRLLAGRLTELRMLFYVGKDLERWLGQCAEVAARDPFLGPAGVTAASFAHLLVEHPPEQLRTKLNAWGVGDYKSIFSRALGLNSVFAQAPSLDTVSSHFVRYYYRYADQMYAARQSSESFPLLPPAQFHFELYASGEYSRLLEREWEQP